MQPAVQSTNQVCLELSLLQIIPFLELIKIKNWGHQNKFKGVLVSRIRKFSATTVCRFCTPTFRHYNKT